MKSERIANEWYAHQRRQLFRGLSINASTTDKIKKCGASSSVNAVSISIAPHNFSLNDTSKDLSSFDTTPNSSFQGSETSDNSNNGHHRNGISEKDLPDASLQLNTLGDSLLNGVSFLQAAARRREDMKYISMTHDVRPGREMMAISSRKRSEHELPKRAMEKSALHHRREKIAQYEALTLIYTTTSRFV